MKLLTITLAIVIALAFLAAACGEGEEEAPGAVTVAVDLDEWTIKPHKASVPAGKVTFKAKNTGKVVHEGVPRNH